MTDPFNLITEDWLKANDFKWHQFDRMPDKHWLLWIGGALGSNTACYEDLGVEVAPWKPSQWFCWLRSDSAGRYHRFIHIRHLETVDDLTGLISGLIGYPFDPANSYYGMLRTPEQAARLREEHDRLDKRLERKVPWFDPEKDDTLGRPLPEHQREWLERRNGGDAP